jgi:diacylglycerol kinase
VLAAIPLVSLTPIEIALLLGAIVAVTAAELFNTVAEALVDLVCPQRHPLARVIKDVAAAGVLVTAAGAALVGSVILWPHLRHLF